MDSEDPTTLLNLGTVSYGLGREEDALHWFKKLPEKNEQIEKWVYELEETMILKNNPRKWMKFLLLRVEHNVQREESLLDIVNLFNTSDDDQLLLAKAIIHEDITEKVNTINLLINSCYENGLYDKAIALLETTLKYGGEPSEVTKLIQAIKTNYLNL
ncbi:hypothetical protein D3C76_933160 [compost metagenome]